MRLLAIETSGVTGGFAVVEDGRVLAEMVADVTAHHLEKGVTMIEQVLDSAGASFDGLDAVAVSLGPGSFTGLRVGLALAKGMCFGRGIPLVGVPTLDCMAEAFRQAQGIVIPVRDARRGEVYFSMYEISRGAPRRLCDYRAMSPGLLIMEIQGLKATAGILLSGDGLSRYGKVFRDMLGTSVIFASEHLWPPSPSIVGHLGARLLESGQPADLDSIEPIYVRLSEAERKTA